MRQVIASQCSIAVFRQSSPAYVAPTLKRVRRGIARSGDPAGLAMASSPFPSSGLSSVTADFVSVFAVLNAVQADFTATFDISAAPGTVTADFTATYDLRNIVQRDFAASFDVASSTGSVVADFTASWNVYNSVSALFVASYRIGDANDLDADRFDYMRALRVANGDPVITAMAQRMATVRRVPRRRR